MSEFQVELSTSGLHTRVQSTQRQADSRPRYSRSSEAYLVERVMNVGSYLSSQWRLRLLTDSRQTTAPASCLLMSDPCFRFRTQE